MAIKEELVKAVKLLLLFCLLIWTMTWNSLPSSRFSYTEDPRIINKVSSQDDHSEKAKEELNIPSNSPNTIIYKSSPESLSTDLALPAFYEWREKERSKYETSNVNTNTIKKTTVRRKLNFASSKCGAKILASNAEAKHRMYVLNERVDEYLLNPCKVRSWFAIELCDSVDVTQIELANYELYSSSPKLFSVHWSEVYPTVVWNHLGTFEAEDKRTMQTFEVKVKNLGKFIKIVIHSHHGNDYYCPLSVIRVLGSSMVQEFDDLEIKTDANLHSSTKTRIENNETILGDSIASGKMKQFMKVVDFNSSISIFYIIDMCLDLELQNSYKICVYNSFCAFIKVFMTKLYKMQDMVCSSKNKTLLLDESPKKYLMKNKTVNLNSSPFINASSSEKFLQRLNKSINKSFKDKYIENKIPHKKESRVSVDSSQTQLLNEEDNLGKSRTEFLNTTFNGSSSLSKNITKSITSYPDKCECKIKESKDFENTANSKILKESETDGKGTLGSSEDSAGLIQKESVLIKLTSRIQVLEIDLNLINRYLQQLSESYRHKMESIKISFERTLKAIAIGSEKAAKADSQQEELISILVKKVDSLSVKITNLVNSQKDSIQQVMELHAFFLVLEVIFVTTIFTVFLNILNSHSKKIIQ